jgi:putative ABC transport system permease protein
MDVMMTVRLANRTLRRNKLRSVLTMLGVIIGVAAVVATLAIGSGARASVQAQIATLGTNVVMVMNGTTSSSGVRSWGTTHSLTYEDAEAIRKECEAVSGVAPTVRSMAQMVSSSGNWGTSIQGTTSDFFAIRDWPVAHGAAFTDADVRGGAKVCVLGATTAENLFPGGQDPVGQVVRIKGLPFRVAGVLSKKGASSMGQSDQDDVVIAPLTTVQKKLTSEPGHVGSIIVSAVAADRVNRAIEEITELLRQRHRIRPGADDDFVVRSQSEFANAAEQTSRTMSLLLLSIAAVSLLVGGIGIMNIMLVSVTERTREIGIRMAVGARARDIRWQFLIESAFLSLLGGAAGVVLGMAASGLITKMARWPTSVSPGVVLLAFVFAAAIGIFFGYSPARRASRLDPIEALRYE